MRRLPSPAPGEEQAWVAAHLADLCCDEPAPSPAFRGTQQAADAALAAFDVSGYARRRNEVWPQHRRGASRLSPYIRYGLLDLRTVWAVAGDGPARDVRKFRDELRWQEYARHLYARLGSAMAQSLRADPGGTAGGADPWDRSMACIELTVGELERDGWLVNQTRMWLASQWTVRGARRWQSGEDRFFTHLIDGSRAANRLGWQWTVGAATSRPYGFSQWQVRKRAPGLCATCVHERACPIAEWPDGQRPTRVEPPTLLRQDPDPAATAGPAAPIEHDDAALVWLTAESLGDGDPALAAHPSLPAAFVFDAPLLARLRLSGKRLVFLTERLAELDRERDLHIYRGDPVDVLAGQPLAATFTPVPGWRRRAAALDIAALHPWRWLERPDGGSLSSFSTWAKRRRD